MLEEHRFFCGGVPEELHLQAPLVSLHPVLAQEFSKEGCDILAVF